MKAAKKGGIMVLASSEGVWLAVTNGKTYAYRVLIPALAARGPAVDKVYGFMSMAAAAQVAHILDGQQDTSLRRSGVMLNIVGLPWALSPKP